MMTQRELEEMSRQECFELLVQEKVGRLVYVDDLGPVAEPVNYALVGETIVLRVEGGSKRQAMTEALLAFEVDHIDADQKSGWSIIIRGPGTEVPFDDVPALVHEFHEMGVDPPSPWPSGIHKVWLRIRIKRLSGRKLGRESSPLIF
jgi:nitroimidazol reductase NimA-like FMN-containing flavoprotein (pyridoxamine 5'-phosphate oxidase superfamily)